MLNLNYLFFFFSRFNIISIKKNINLLDLKFNFKSNFFISYNIIYKKEFYINYKLYWYKHISFLSNLCDSHNYFVYLYGFLTNNNLSKNFNFYNIYTNILSMDNALIFLNFKKRWLYNVKDSRLFLKKYFFFLKNCFRLTQFIQKTKNSFNLNFLSSSSYNILSLCMSQGFSYNFKSFLNLLNKYVIYVNYSKLPLQNPHYFIKVNDVVSFYFTKNNIFFFMNSVEYYYSILKNDYYMVRKLNYKNNVMFRKSIFFFVNNTLPIKYCLEKNYLNMSFFKLNLKQKFFVNTTINTSLNLTNLRLYNWLIIN